MAAALGDAFELEVAVQAIEQLRGGVDLVIDGDRYRADWCVLAAPLPAVRRIRLSPAPPAALAAALRIQMGTGAKTMLQCSRRGWVAAGESGDSLTDLDFGTTWEATPAQAGRSGILIAYTAGARGDRYARLGAAARTAAAVASVDHVFPGVRATLRATATHSWTTDRWAGGTYLAPAPGQVALRPALRAPWGRVVLAGEHVAPLYQGYMEGALRSGRDAAAAVARLAG